MERLEAADIDRFLFEEDRDPLAPAPEESVSDRANRQLKILDTVIGGRLRLELDLLQKSQSLAREIASRPGTRGAESFASVFVMPDAAESELQEGKVGEDLLSDSRHVQLERTLNAWDRAIGIAAIAIGQSLEG